jgi:ABC-type Fe3+ transport system permease subunit
LVALPRARTSVLAAVLFVVLQTAGEVSVTEMLLVSTLAEEVRGQFALADRNALARTLLLAAPSLLVTWSVVLVVLAYLEKHLPPPAPSFRSHRPLPLASPQIRFVAAFLLLSLLLAPLLSLVWRLGLSGHPSHWTFTTARHFLQAETRLLGGDLLFSLGTSLVAGAMTAGVALTGCWLAREARWFRVLLFSVVTLAWILPGPVVGIGLHDLVMILARRWPNGPLAMALYHGPSPLPMMWVQTIRTMPIAVVFFWPVVRMIPREWFEEARLGGAGTVSEFLHVIAPTTWRAALVTALASSALCLAEVAASARVETPGWESFTKMLLDRMHYGVDNTLAALSVLMLASLVALALIGAMLWKTGSRLFRRRRL